MCSQNILEDFKNGNVIIRFREGREDKIEQWILERMKQILSKECFHAWNGQTLNEYIESVFGKNAGKYGRYNILKSHDGIICSTVEPTIGSEVIDVIDFIELYDEQMGANCRTSADDFFKTFEV